MNEAHPALMVILGSVNLYCGVFIFRRVLKPSPAPLVICCVFAVVAAGMLGIALRVAAWFMGFNWGSLAGW